MCFIWIEICRFGFKIVVQNGANKKKSDRRAIRTIRIYQVAAKYHQQRLLHPHYHPIRSHIWALICENRSTPAAWPHFAIHTYRAHRCCHQHIYINFTGNWSIELNNLFIFHFFLFLLLFFCSEFRRKPILFTISFHLRVQSLFLVSFQLKPFLPLFCSFNFNYHFRMMFN